MTTETLIIRNFGPIREATLELKRYLVLIGQQASGKSTIAKVIAIFRDIDFLEGGIKTQEQAKIHFKNFNIHNYFSADSYFFYNCSRYTIELNNSIWDIKVTDEFRNDIFHETNRIISVLRNVVENQSKQSPEKGNEVDKEALFQTYFTANRKSMFSLLKKQIYIPTERTFFLIIQPRAFTFGGLPLPKYFQDFGIQYEYASNTFPDLAIDYLGIKIKRTKEGIKVFFDENHSVLLNESASGIQTVFPLHIVVDFLKGGAFTFIAEEPELNLFPTTQKGLINFLIAMSHTPPDISELIVTTHSPYILAILNNLLFAHITANRHPNRVSEIERIIPRNNWINPSEFAAYSLSNGYAYSIHSEETGLISENELDAISENISGEYEELMSLYV